LKTLEKKFGVKNYDDALKLLKKKKKQKKELEAELNSEIESFEEKHSESLNEIGV
jgi:prefoldin subunit 5